MIFPVLLFFWVFMSSVMEIFLYADRVQVTWCWMIFFFFFNTPFDKVHSWQELRFEAFYAAFADEVFGWCYEYSTEIG